MQAPAIPPNEVQRLAELIGLGLLDTQAEERFDRITRLAASLLDVPIALISLIDADRQWFKSAVGLDAPQTPRDISFCGHAILGDDLFEVSNALNDDRFADNPLVTGPPDIRFYAGQPLHASSGHRIGTLCVIDREPRTLTSAQKYTLKELANIIDRELLQQTQLRALCINEERLKLAIKSAGVGIWEYDTQTQALVWDDAMFALYGARREDFSGAYDAWASRLHPDDKAATEAAVTEALAGGSEYTPEFRVVWANGEVHYLKGHAWVIRNAAGHALRMIGTNWDITEVKRQEAHLAFVISLKHSLVRITSPGELMSVACQRIAEHLGLRHCVMQEIDQVAGITTVLHEHLSPGTPPLAHIRPLSEVRTPEQRQELAAGKTLVSVDVTLEPRPQVELQRLAARGTRAQLSAPYVVDRQWKFLLTAVHGKPYHWHQHEVDLLSQLAGVTYSQLERTRAQQAQALSATRLKLATQAAHIGIWELTLPDQTRVWDDTMYTLFGARREDFPNPTDVWNQRLHPEDRGKPEAELQASLEHGQPYAPEFRILLPNGEERILKGHAQVVHNHKSQKFIGTCSDITDHKRRERNLAFLADLQKTLSMARNSADIVHVASVRITEHMKFHRCLLVELDEAIGQVNVIHDLQQPESDHHLSGRFPLSLFRTDAERKDLAEGKIVVSTDAQADPRSPEELQRLRARGVRALLSVPYLADGRLKFVLTASRNEAHAWPQEDIDLFGELAARIFPRLERARVIDALSASEERMRLAAEAARFGMFDRDLHSGEFHVSGQLKQMLGYPEDMEVGYAMVLSHVHPDDLEACKAAFNRANDPMSDGRIYSEQRIIRRDGALCWILIVGRVVFERGEPVRSLGFWLNITDRKSMENALRNSEREQKRATEAAEAANQAKSVFLATMSHEMRTPLNGVMGMLELLLLENLTPPQRHFAELANTSARTMLNLVNDLLDIGKIEAGKLEIERVPFGLHELLSELSSLYSLRAREKGLGFSAPELSDLPDQLLGDPDRVRQILNNLLANALKFTRQGSFGLRVEQLGRSEAETREHTVSLRFAVHDTGIGIAPEAQGKLFTRFTQIDSSNTREFGGSGLGLAIVKQLCQHMGGTVHLSSTPGQGSVFSCELRFERASQDAFAPMSPDVTSLEARESKSVLDRQDPAPQVPTPARKILAAEDDSINQVVRKAMLQKMGYTQVTMVGNGQEAIEVALSGGFDAILMDCRMPVKDGYEATMELRARGLRLPIIALTANAAPIDYEKCLAAGMNDFLTKPCNAATLKRALERWLPQPNQAATPNN